VDETEIRKRMTLQIQAETLGRADQKEMAERRKAKYRSQDLSAAEKQRAQGRPRIRSRQQLVHGLARVLPKAGAASILAPSLHLVGKHHRDLPEPTTNTSSAKVLMLRKVRAKLKS
jgi:hypothetical protein